MNAFIYISILLLNIPLAYVYKNPYVYIKSPLSSIFFWSILIFNIVGSFFVFFPEFNRSSSYNYLTDDYVYLLLISTLSFYFWLPIHLSAFSTLKFRSNGVIKKDLITSKIFVFLLILISSALILGSIYINGIPPFWKLDFGDQSSTISTLIGIRTDGLDQTSYIWLFQLGFYTFPMIAVITSMIISENKSFRIKSYWKIILIISLIASLSFMHKTPAVLLLIAVFLGKLMSNNDKLPLRKLILYTFSFFFVIVSWYLIYMWNYGFEYIVATLPMEILNRIFGSYTMSLAVIVHYIEFSSIEFASALSINPLGLMPEMQNLSRIAHYEIFGFPGNAPPPWIGYAFVNFGYAGVIGQLVFINMIFIFFHKCLSYIQQKPIKIALTAFICIRCMYLGQSSLEEVFLNPTFILSIFFILFIYFLSIILNNTRINLPQK